ncbi:MAG: type II toxin-antitoxin system VapC family toxin [Devosia nanyangense]|uniref:Type II toxin-antitoxin system VapC family toxin n=1 Tax=Devosia nanyangense TaxID=1228055 RepID=A0A933L0Q6_9HYPH|nr:type II toxin-antitoxin system VapC family toxin [Devosia nanyangense]
MTIDLPAALRRIKPEKHLEQLAPRPLASLVAASAIPAIGRPSLLLDTNAYIMSAAGTLPDAAAGLMDRGLLFHCSVCITELTTGVANADPAQPGWPAVRSHYGDLIASLPASRVLTPDAQIWTEAGLIAGTLARTQRFQRHQRKECLNDALIYLTAASFGLPVLTADRDDFDLIQQLAPQGAFVHF